MADKTDPARVDHAVQEYLAGKRAIIVQRETGVSRTVIYKALRSSAPQLIRGRRRRIDATEMVRLYLTGVSEKALADRFGVNRWTVRARLVENGVAARGRSEAEFVKWANMTLVQRERQVAAAHAATRGRRCSLEERIKRAHANMLLGNYISHYEREFAAMLASRGVADVVLQQAVGPYNCDFGIAPVAVEIYGGYWHWGQGHLIRTPERYRYILNAGWHILAIRIIKKDGVGRAIADYTIAFVEQMRRDPTLRRQYRVIGGRAKLLAGGSIDDDEITIVPALTRRFDGRSGNEGVPG